MLHHQVLTRNITIFVLVKTQVTYIKLLSHGKNTVTIIYQRELATQKIFPKIQLTICSKGLNLNVYIWTTFGFLQNVIGQITHKTEAHSK